MKIINRKFHRDYQELEKYEAGIVLTGAEVKAVRQGRLKLNDSFIKIIGGEVYLVNAQIPVYQYARAAGYDDKRTRKLLMHSKEILRLKTKIQAAAGLTVVPISCYNKHGVLKLEVALAKGRSTIGKKRLEKARDIKREQQREVKEYVKN
ncbi:SsrA-binding protein [Candidatus Roizmanbacteria bacterium CG02_land_8_20_14_3_00_36_15]|uniref:SsrA-binding protein n=2 Tax=Candidatus Roizmaniibacteriota TaxID=1752723 RepID=A0A2M8KK90_9BACT|nr:MAG: SsrA-binding protein [Candidatus Roizmanbacteria bacterium CG03_land_8_20_14_0_80_36_21]PIV37467.1 MAG: SsrA-binding protein [Candidatus Roizmanbacteria bacterium CG02_land_8_20_14_3_00_36_15]PIY70542.1 MAG: SsrA-binding protein [Candidatus Roizmanbacteria bacterium CG_4_10_14_0_8_um_filter_36_36]PJA52652.1 MAG: SsrA-binding protein [Candidatus Roizmanbacteria bacterium CG_4_9_14_3_um_filter_36_11]PJC81554.1 MAG: SsrA-binding protein [Candidatus Roizmanbacteria bacterium CG_4_8_14_3_um_